MVKSELFQSEAVFRPGMSPAHIHAETEDQYRALGRKVVELLRVTPTMLFSLGVEKERAEHMERDPRKSPPTVHRLVLKALHLDSADRATADELWKIINQLQRRVLELEKQTIPA